MMTGEAFGVPHRTVALADTTPAFHPKRGTGDLPVDARYRSYPDGEIVAGTPIPAVVPLPGKPCP